MGVNLKDILIKKEISVEDLRGKKCVVDAFNVLYQFLATIRQRDGTPLMDSKNRITSHLTGLFNRTAKLMSFGIKLAFVFDGTPPELKKVERQRRAELKKEAELKHKEAVQKKDVDEMKKYAMRTTRLTPEMINEAKELIAALGLPVIQAPSEGEAQAAFMVAQGDIDYEISQDYDCLLFGVPRLVQNLTITERKKMPSKLSYERVTPKLVELRENLDSLGIDNDQLIVVAMLVGTDFNVGGIKGLGPKKALELVKKHGKDFDELFEEARWSEHFDYPWKEVFDLFKNMPVEKDYELRWRPADKEKVMQILVEEHDFSKERVESTLENMEKHKNKQSQKGLGDFI